jgi:hypothetical protein
MPLCDALLYVTITQGVATAALEQDGGDLSLGEHAPAVTEMFRIMHQVSSLLVAVVLLVV